MLEAYFDENDRLLIYQENAKTGEPLLILRKQSFFGLALALLEYLNEEGDQDEPFDLSGDMGKLNNEDA